MLLDGCHEGKHTPRLSEVKCPKCGVDRKNRFGDAERAAKEATAQEILEHALTIVASSDTFTHKLDGK